MKSIGNRWFGILAVLFVFFGAAGLALAQTDITSAVSTVSGYWDAVKVLAIAIVLFVIGRRVLRKI